MKRLIEMLAFLAEGVGFEPTELSLNGFQDRRLKPLGHPSTETSRLNSISDLQRQCFYPAPASPLHGPEDLVAGLFEACTGEARDGGGKPSPIALDLGLTGLAGQSNDG